MSAGFVNGDGLCLDMVHKLTAGWVGCFGVRWALSLGSGDWADRVMARAAKR